LPATIHQRAKRKLKMKRLRILHIINDLGTGGATMMLYKLLFGTDQLRFEPIVLSLMDHGKYGDSIEALGIQVHTIDMKGGLPIPAKVWQCIQKVHQLKPDLIISWMYHSSFAAQVSNTFRLQSVPIIWNIRQSTDSFENTKPSTTALIKLLAKLSSFSLKIIYNSHVGASQHEKLGYRATKTVVIPNGFDTNFFAPSQEHRISIRAELGIANETFLIGRVGRYHPMKDYSNFLHAAAFLLKKYPDTHFILAGSEVDGQNQNLCEIIHNLGIANRTHLLGERRDIVRLTAALDIATSTSVSNEGFPNVIGEAMSCGVPCVVTDVGDSAWIVGDTGRVVPPRNSEVLAQAWKELIDMGSEGREALGKAARARIMECFSLDSVVAQYEELYESLLANQ
jgi:glycosyltransferase involved in cell wall biosynthesis